MSGFNDVFGGTALQPADVSYAALSLSASTASVWPPYYTGAVPYLAKLMEVTPDLAGYSLAMPAANLASPGEGTFFFNAGALSFTITDFDGNSLATVAAGTWRYVYILTNATAAGTWRTTQLGTTTSSPDASQLAGPGLKAVGAALVQSAPVTTISANTVFSASDRAKVYVNTGGAITGTLPTAASVSNDFFFELRNQGTGVMTLTATGGDTVDGSASISLQINESCFVHAGTGAWYTVGRGRNAQFNFSQLITATTGGTKTLSLSEAGNVVQTYTGALLSNQTVVVPSVVQVYYFINKTTGAFTFTVSCAGGGASLVIPSNQNAVLFCDGTNVYNAATVVVGLSAFLLAAGSVSSPSAAFVNTNNGFFAPSGTTMAVSSGGTEAMRWDGTQSKVPNASAALPAYSFTVSPTTGWYSPAADQIAGSIAGAQKFLLTATGLGIGKTPAAPLDINGTAWATSFSSPSGNLAWTGNQDFTAAVTTAATQAGGDNSTKVATTAHVFANYAVLASPAFTGTPTAPTAPGGTNTTQLATTAYVVSAGLSSALPGQAGNAGKYITTDGTTATWGSIKTVWTVKAANYTMVVGDAIMANTAAGAFTLTLPAAPAANDRIPLCDYGNTFQINNLTVGANGNKIHGTVADMIFTSYFDGAFTYIDATQGWKITP